MNLVCFIVFFLFPLNIHSEELQVLYSGNDINYFKIPSNLVEAHCDSKKNMDENGSVYFYLFLKTKEKLIEAYFPKFVYLPKCKNKLLKIKNMSKKYKYFNVLIENLQPTDYGPRAPDLYGVLTPSLKKGQKYYMSFLMRIDGNESKNDCIGFFEHTCSLTEKTHFR